MKLDWSKLWALVLQLWPLIKEIIVIVGASGIFMAAKDAPTSIQAFGVAADVGVAGTNIFAWLAGLVALLKTGGGGLALLQKLLNLLVSSGFISIDPPIKTVEAVVVNPVKTGS